jgi:hypothetical protein
MSRKPIGRQFTATIPPKVMEEIEHLATVEERSVSQMMVELLREALSNRKDKQDV